MTLLRMALRNLARRGRSYFVVAVLMAVGVADYFVGNAVPKSLIGGIKQAFSDIFIADLSISKRSD